MARKETVIPEKVIKSKVNVEVTCDCCGCEVKKYWLTTLKNRRVVLNELYF